MNIRQDNEDSSYLFNVDILIKNQFNAIALQFLIEMLNQNEHVLDFKVKSGIKLGGMIDSLLEAKNNPPAIQINVPKSTTSNNINMGTMDQTGLAKRMHQRPIPTSKQRDPNNKPVQDPRSWIKACITDNRLVRLTANRQGQHFNIPCRILNFDEEKQFINIYHVDEKQVYSFNLNEIDSFDS